MSSTEIVPDSTTHESIRRQAMMDTSPFHSSRPSSPSPPTITTTKPQSASQQPSFIRRSSNAITYGRRKLAEEPLPTPDASIVIDTSTTSTRFDQQVTPPDSDKDDDESDDEGNSKFVFSFRKDLEIIDKQYDEEEDTRQPSAAVQEHAPLQKSSSLSTLPTESEPFSSPRATLKTNLSKPRRSVTTLESASEAESDDDQSPKSPSPVKQRSVHRPIKRRAIVDSDSENEGNSSRKSSPAQRQTTPSRPSSSRPALEQLFDDDSPLKQKSSPRSSSGNNAEQDPVSDASSSSRSKSRGAKSRNKDKTKAGKIRPPTKKELRETRKEQTALLAAQCIEVPREEAPRLSVGSIVAKIASQYASGKKGGLISSDPISSSPGHSFTNAHAPLKREDSSTLSEIANSSPLRPSATLTPGLTKSTSTRRSTPETRTPLSDPPSAPPAKQLSLFGIHDDDDEEMPSINEITKHSTELENKKKAAEMKKLVLARQKAAEAARRHHEEDDDDDLEIENAGVEESQESLVIVEKVPGKLKTSQALARHVLGDQLASAQKKKRTISLAKPPPGFDKRKSEQSGTTESQLIYAARHNRFGLTDSKDLSKPRKSIGNAAKGVVQQDQIFKMLKEKIDVHSKQIRNDKEQEWVDRGGKLKSKGQGEGDEGALNWMKLLEKKRENGEEDTKMDEDEDPEDGDYAPDNEDADEEEEEYRGSASPSPAARRLPATQSEDEATDDAGVEDKENLPPPLRNRSRTDSASSKENEIATDKENVPPPLQRGSIVQGGGGLMDEDDLFSPRKRIDQEEEDKENAPPPPSRKLTFGGDENDDDDEEDGWVPGRARKRRALRNVIMDDDDEESESSRPLPAFGSPIANDENAPPRPQSSRKLQFAVRELKFDMDSDEEESNAAAKNGGLFGNGKPLGKALFHSSQESLSLGDGFDFFGDGEGDGMTQLFKMEDTKRKSFDNLREDPFGTIDLESQKLLPAMVITTQERKIDEAIFQEDQEARAMLDREELLKEKRGAKAPRYITEDGFLTQTKPYSQAIPLPDSPEISKRRGSDVVLTPATVIESGIGTQLDLEDDGFDDSMEERPFKRLVRGERPADRSPSPPRPLNAFQIMMTGPPKKPKQLKEKLKSNGKSVFVQGEAEESDEEVVFGFGGAGLKEDEEEGEEDDKPLEGLVDDNHLSQDALNADAVMEKVMEHAAQDDAELEKLHQAAADGKLRGKKRDRGIGIDGDSDSDDEEADERNRRRRHAMMKKRKIKADDLEALARNSKTVAFYNHYQRAITLDEDNEFGHVPTSDVEDNHERRDRRSSDDEDQEDGFDNDGDDEDTQEKPKKTISTYEVERLAVEAMAKGVTPFDPDNVNWVDSGNEDLDDYMDIKEVTISKQSLSKVFGQQEVDQEMKREQFRFERIRGAKLTSDIRKQEDKSSSTAKAAAAVTGHKTKAKSSASSVSASQTSSSSKASGKLRKSLKKAPTILGGISRKQSGFES
ncbi:hypothetical protein FRC03_012824 [Tulasnella sp. 419]|nr:hypothetical protein FRC03_012824 [Tulasnella sp. 419]